MRPDQQRLQDAAEPDRLGEFLERGRFDAAARLERVWLQQIERYLADGRSLRRGLHGGIAEQGGKPAAKPAVRLSRLAFMDRGRSFAPEHLAGQADIRLRPG